MILAELVAIVVHGDQSSQLLSFTTLERPCASRQIACEFLLVVSQDVVWGGGGWVHKRNGNRGTGRFEIHFTHLLV